MSNISTLTFNALDNALENGYDYTKRDPSAVVEDLCIYNRDHEEYAAAHGNNNILQAVTAWQHMKQV